MLYFNETQLDEVYDILFQYHPDEFSSVTEFLQFIKDEHGGNISEQELDSFLYEAGEYYDELSEYGGDYSRFIKLK